MRHVPVLIIMGAAIFDLFQGRARVPAVFDSQLTELVTANSSEIYWLIYLLTGNREGGGTSCAQVAVRENPGFTGFMSDWARKLVISSALGTMRPQLQKSIEQVRSAHSGLPIGPLQPMSPEKLTKTDLGRAVLAIDAFPRCVLVLTIFESMPAAEAARLLGVDTKLLKSAQAIALTELTRNLAQRAAARN